MEVSYKKLWKLLIDKDMKKRELCELADISAASITKMGRNGHVSTETLQKICTALHCDIGDIMEIVPGKGSEKNTQVIYRYTDASNYHACNVAVIQGTLTEEQKKIILDCLDPDGFFVPSAVGFDVWLPWEYDPQDDHPFWSLDEDSFEETTRQPTVNITAEQLVAAFVACKGDWERLGVEYTPDFDDFEDDFIEDIVVDASLRSKDASGTRKEERGTRECVLE